MQHRRDGVDQARGGGVHETPEKISWGSTRVSVTFKARKHARLSCRAGLDLQPSASEAVAR
jgi:hypothetical protein